MTTNIEKIISSLDLTKRCKVKIVSPRENEEHDENTLIKTALNNPIKSKSFCEFIKPCKRILIVVNDATRATPTRKVMKHIMPLMKNKDITVIVATGAHREPTENEYRTILGEFYRELRDKTTFNDARDMSTMKFYGVTSRGTKVYVNNIIERNDCIIVIGSTEPHYFAGFTGGRKGIVPGIAGYETIEHNHSFAILPEAKILKLKRNPVHEDLVEATLLATRNIPTFAINTVLDKNHNLYACTAGDLIESHLASVKFAKEVFTVNVKEKADIVIAVTNPPLDINLYQAQKSLENVRLIIRQGGIIILVARCQDGIGPRNFYDLLVSGRSPQEIFEKIEKEYKLGYHKAAKLITLQKVSTIYAVTKIDTKTLERIGIQKFQSLEDALNVAIRKLKEYPCNILFVRDAAMLVPIPQ